VAVREPSPSLFPSPLPPFPLSSPPPFAGEPTINLFGGVGEEEWKKGGMKGARGIYGDEDLARPFLFFSFFFLSKAPPLQKRAVRGRFSSPLSPLFFFYCPGHK